MLHFYAGRKEPQVCPRETAGTPRARILPYSGRRGAGLYDRAFAGAQRRLGRRLAALAGEWATAEALVAELLAQPPARRTLLLRNRRSACSWPLCQLLVDAAEDWLGSRPARAQELAALAIEGAAQLDAAVYGGALIADLSACAWGTLGEALRRRGRLAAATAALAIAAQHLDAGSGDPQTAEALRARRAALRAVGGRRRTGTAPAARAARATHGSCGEAWRVVRD